MLARQIRKDFEIAVSQGERRIARAIGEGAAAKRRRVKSGGQACLGFGPLVSAQSKNGLAGFLAENFATRSLLWGLALQNAGTRTLDPVSYFR
jgi:hypothetical protein